MNTPVTEEIAEKLRGIAYAAGKAIMDVYESGDMDITAKDDDSPLTRADSAAHDIIEAGLRGLPEAFRFPVLSEEGDTVTYAERAQWHSYYCIDPLDGTREFIKKNGEFTVNIALVVEGVPAYGVVFAPAQDLWYYGGTGVGAWKQENGRTVPIDADYGERTHLAVVASRSHLTEETETYIHGFKKAFDTIKTVSSGSSLKLCMVAEGTADLYPRLAPTMEWDTAAADAVCRAAGCTVVEYHTGTPLIYNKENLLNPWFIVKGKRL